MMQQETINLSLSFEEIRRAVRSFPVPINISVSQLKKSASRMMKIPMSELVVSTILSADGVSLLSQADAKRVHQTRGIPDDVRLTQNAGINFRLRSFTDLSVPVYVSYECKQVNTPHFYSNDSLSIVRSKIWIGLAGKVESPQKLCIWIGGYQNMEKLKDYEQTLGELIKEKQLKMQTINEQDVYYLQADIDYGDNIQIICIDLVTSKEQKAFPVLIPILIESEETILEFLNSFEHTVREKDNEGYAKELSNQRNKLNSQDLQQFYSVLFKNNSLNILVEENIVNEDGVFQKKEEKYIKQLIGKKISQNMNLSVVLVGAVDEEEVNRLREEEAKSEQERLNRPQNENAH